MRTFVVRRLGVMVLQLLAVLVGIFLLLRAMPVDPISRVVGIVSTPAARQQARTALGISGSVWDQLGHYLTGLLHGSFGGSWSTHLSVGSEIVQRFPVTIQLVVLSFGVALAIALFAGRAAASNPGGRLDRFVRGYSLFAGSQPDFWWGLVFIFLLYFKLKLFPAPLGLLSSNITPPANHTNFILLDALLAGNLPAFTDALWHLFLPVFTLAFILTGPLIKMTRQSVLGVADSDYVLYAKAAGLPDKRVSRYVLRNALAPVMTLSGILFGFMLGGAVLIETIFSLDGLGKYALDRTLATDFPAVQGTVIVMTAFSLLMYLLMDVVHAALDPRVRYGVES